MIENVDMKDRCGHVIDPIGLKCTKCGAPWTLAVNDARPYRSMQSKAKPVESKRST